MRYEYRNGAIRVSGSYFEEMRYDISNEKIAVLADGKGGLLSYRVADKGEDRLSTFFAFSLSLNGQPLDPYLEKTVEMIGRTQSVSLPEAGVTTALFLSKDDNGVFFEISAKAGDILSVTLNCRNAKSETHLDSDFIRGANFLLSSSEKGDWITENDAFYLEARGSVKLFFSFDNDEAAHRQAFLAFDRKKAEAKEEIEQVSVPASVKTEEEKALYLAAYFTALENHKTLGSFRAFAAGIAYLEPLRTYFRDGYFTLLPLYLSHPDYVRDEILTLARGIAPDGSCPSAVKRDFTAFWGDHFDSPSFFVMMISDYVRHTDDETLLEEKIGDVTLLKLADKVLTKLSARADETGLLYKAGDYNKRDWADEVNRNGYVTYVEALYARALACASSLYQGRDEAASAKYEAAYRKVKDAINTLLFDREKGYYVNYKTRDFTEDNLSVDTVFTLLFGIADKEKAESVLDKMEALLETRNNQAQKGGDFGVMSVYPLYKERRATAHKSMRPFDYHNGANWCYLTAMYAYAKYLYGRDYAYPLLSCFSYNVRRGHYTPVEYFSPCAPTGGSLQGWSAAIAFTYQYIGKASFFDLK
ncbi:MAG: hypothetical protein J6Y74_05950 [Clostridia bacterium]|nr:hypothetical protein [Clostridia bacterium]